MTALDTLLAVEAFVAGSAQQRTSVRHRHVADNPMVLVAYRMAGEAGAPLGIMYGTDPDSPELLVAPEPRNRDMRFREVFEPLAAAVDSWLNGYLERDEEEQCIACPQVLVPNRGTHGFVGSVLGRSLRYLRSTDDFPISDTTVALGAHATWFARQSELPGSCVLVAATDLLRRHWVTGQSNVEDEDLHVLLSWIDPPPGTSGREAAAAMEAARAASEMPAVGPTPDATWDRDILEPLLAEFNATRSGDASGSVVSAHGGPIRSAVADALGHAWRATWRAHELLAGLPEGSTVADRWASDQWAWTSHVTRVEEGRAFFRTRDSARQSAWIIKSREDAQQALDLGEALDDPMVVAGLVAVGDAVDGDVVDVDTENMEMGPSGRRRVRRPLITVALPEPCPMPIGTNLRWTDRVQLETELIAVEGGVCTLKVIGGVRGDLPAVGASAAFITLDNRTYPTPSTVPGTPWTHIGADVPEPDSEVPE